MQQGSYVREAKMRDRPVFEDSLRECVHSGHLDILEAANETELVVGGGVGSLLANHDHSLNGS